MLTRAHVDRARWTAVKLGGWNPISALALCDEIHRLHDVLEAARHANAAGHPSGVEALLWPESDPAWGRPIVDMPPEEPKEEHPGEPAGVIEEVAVV